ncbi:unnamed protein product [Spirodela intermedia]|uniref:Uncharacterized protein n=1 Tax=Spirodela intermedia TaxID=51605 RepID=A0A7I8JDM6_SPIIN|nr:unnamed protein product [Spirodela intermedia]CAA6668199.1 unnamed protein product [Spirodela intermedia]
MLTSGDDAASYMAQETNLLSQKINKVDDLESMDRSVVNTGTAFVPRKAEGRDSPKLESWSSGKLHTPLKSLLMEANNESKQETLNPLTKPPQATSGSWAPPEEAARASKQLNKGFAKREAQKEWNSPARLPSNQNDRRRIKGRPSGFLPLLPIPQLGLISFFFLCCIKAFLSCSIFHPVL